MSAPFRILVTMAAVAASSTGAFAQVTKGFDGNTVYETRLSNFPECTVGPRILSSGSASAS